MSMNVVLVPLWHKLSSLSLLAEMHGCLFAFTASEWKSFILNERLETVHT